MDERERVLLTLAGVRAFMGVFWLVNVLWRLPTDFGKGEYWGLPRTLDVARHYALTPPLRSLVDDVLIPHSPSSAGSCSSWGSRRVCRSCSAT